MSEWQPIMNERDALLYLWGIIVGGTNQSGDVNISAMKMEFISKKIIEAIYGIPPSLFVTLPKDNGVV